jgi:hypothetical protein
MVADDLKRRLSRSPVSFDELDRDWLPRLEAEGIACRIGWIDPMGRPCEIGEGDLALLYERGEGESGREQ